MELLGIQEISYTRIFACLASPLQNVFLNYEASAAAPRADVGTNDPVDRVVELHVGQSER